MLKNSVLIFVMLSALSGAAAAADQELGNLLTSRYRDQVLALRHSFNARSQEYNSDGTPLTKGSEGSWTVYGRIGVKKVSVGADLLQIEGDRVVFESDGPGKPLQPVRERERIRITIRLNHAVASEDEAVAVLGRVFALTPQDVVDSAPRLWRAYLAKQLDVPSGPKNDATRDAAARDKPASDGKTGVEIVRDNAGHEKVFKLGKEITAPKPQFTPEPEYSDVARKLRFQGMLGLNCVIDNTGRVRGIAIAKPLGLGLDEKAADAVGTWRFAPGKLDGQPVTVAMYIEVDFRLYDRR
ncbi:MAG TPA: energy transducer TonB [Candidatus Angelobacter sp.]